MAIATKGWTERQLMWEIPFHNLMMYSLCMPTYDSDGDGKGKVKGNGKVVDMFSMFDNMGK